MSTTEPNRTATAITRHRFNNVRKTEQIFDLSAFLFWKLGSHSYVPWHGDKSRTPPFLLSWRFSDSGFVFNRPRSQTKVEGLGMYAMIPAEALRVWLLRFYFGILASWVLAFPCCFRRCFCSLSFLGFSGVPTQNWVRCPGTKVATWLPHMSG